MAVQAGSLMSVVEESSVNENSIESMQEEYRKTCKYTINLKYTINFNRAKHLVE